MNSNLVVVSIILAILIIVILCNKSVEHFRIKRPGDYTGIPSVIQTSNIDTGDFEVMDNYYMELEIYNIGRNLYFNLSFPKLNMTMTEDSNGEPLRLYKQGRKHIYKGSIPNIGELTLMPTENDGTYYTSWVADITSGLNTYRTTLERSE